MTTSPRTRLTPADSFLCAALRAYLDPERTAEFADAAGSVHDWPSVLSRATEHGVAPLLAELAARPGASTLPPDIAAQLNSERTGHALHALRLHAESKQVLAALAEAAVSPIVLKGPALAFTVYPDAAMREYSDLDLFITEAEWQAARSALLALGGIAEGRDLAELPPRLTQDDALDHWFSYRLPSGLRVECGFDPLQLGLRMRSSDDVRERAIEFEAFPGSKRLSPEDELVVLCVHLNRHGYRRLIWFLDIALLLRAHPSLDWSRVSALARREGVLASVHHTLGLASDLLDIRVRPGLRATAPHRLASAVWRRRWERRGASPLDGEHEGPLVFRKRLAGRSVPAYATALASNVALTGRSGAKLSYFGAKALPSGRFLRERFGHETDSSSYASLWLRRLKRATQSSETEGPAGSGSHRPATNRAFNRAVGWNAISKLSTRGMQFLVTIVLARLLLPADFGLASMTTIVTGMIMIFAEFGFAYALVQKLELTDDDISTAWSVSVVLGVLSTAALLLVAPWVASLFHDASLTAPLRVASLGMLVVSFAITPRALLTRGMDFRSIAIADTAGSVAYGVASIALAAAGAGVWSLVVGGLLLAVARSSMVIARVKRTFRPRVSSESLRALTPFGARVFATNAVEFMRGNIDYFIVGRMLGSAPLGIYTIAFRITDFPRARLGMIVSDVAFPTMSSVQDDPESIRRAYTRSVYTSALFTLPVLIGLAVISYEFVAAVYGPKWLGAVEPLQILLLSGLILAVTQSAQNVLLATGKPQLTLRLSVAYAIAVGTFAWVGVSYGIIGVAFGVLAASILYALGFLALIWRTAGITPARTAEGLLVPGLASAVMALGLVAYRSLVPFPDGAAGLAWLAGAAVVAALAYAPIAWTSARKRGARAISLDRIRTGQSAREDHHPDPSSATDAVVNS